MSSADPPKLDIPFYADYGAGDEAFKVKGGRPKGKRAMPACSTPHHPAAAAARAREPADTCAAAGTHQVEHACAAIVCSTMSVVRQRIVYVRACVYTALSRAHTPNTTILIVRLPRVAFLGI